MFYARAEQETCGSKKLLKNKQCFSAQQFTKDEPRRTSAERTQSQASSAHGSIGPGGARGGFIGESHNPPPPEDYGRPNNQFRGGPSGNGNYGGFPPQQQNYGGQNRGGQGGYFY